MLSPLSFSPSLNATSSQLKIIPSAGGILVFLPGRGDINALAHALGVLRQHPPDDTKLEVPFPLALSKLFIVLAHSELPEEELDQVFAQAPEDSWKVILSTNLAESSITVENLGFVVDSGFVNVKVFDAKTGDDSSIQVHVSEYMSIISCPSLSMFFIVSTAIHLAYNVTLDLELLTRIREYKRRRRNRIKWEI